MCAVSPQETVWKDVKDTYPPRSNGLLVRGIESRDHAKGTWSPSRGDSLHYLEVV